MGYDDCLAYRMLKEKYLRPFCLLRCAVVNVMLLDDVKMPTSSGGIVTTFPTDWNMEGTIFLPSILGKS